MAAGKVGGTSPSEPEKDQTARMQEHRRIEKVEKVKSIDEVENERARKQRFRSFMEEDEEPPLKKSPSPLESSFYNKSASSPLTPPRPSLSETLGSIPQEIVPDPAHSVPPNVQFQSPQPMANPQTDNSLPRNQSFWNSTDTSSQPQSENNYQEVSSSPDKSTHKKKTSDIVPNQLPKTPLTNKLRLEDKDKISAKDSLKVEKVRKTHPEKPIEAVSPTLSERDPKQPRFSSKMESKTPREKKTVSAPEKETQSPVTGPFNLQEKGSYDPESNSGGKKHRDKQSIEIIAPSTTPMPAHIETIAQTAAMQSMSLVSPQIAPLFFQMVGTIHMMASPSGVSRTEVILNSPAFANSRFFGSKILIERYSTAPDAFNIRLTGTNEAVAAFQQNISGLYAAFQSRNFPFRIGRISAEYAIEKPLFRRKDSKGKAGDDGEDFTDTRGSK
jgi:hypothetical protein